MSTLKDLSGLDVVKQGAVTDTKDDTVIGGQGAVEQRDKVSSDAGIHGQAVAHFQIHNTLQCLLQGHQLRRSAIHQLDFAPILDSDTGLDQIRARRVDKLSIHNISAIAYMLGAFSSLRQDCFDEKKRGIEMGETVAGQVIA